MPEPTDTLNAREAVIDRLRLERSAALRRAKAAEAEVARLREREADWAASVDQEQSHLHHCRGLLEAAEARVARLEEALERYWAGDETALVELRLSALAHEEEK